MNFSGRAQKDQIFLARATERYREELEGTKTADRSVKIF